MEMLESLPASVLSALLTTVRRDLAVPQLQKERCVVKKQPVTFLLFVCIFAAAFAGSVLADSLGDPFDGNSLQNPDWQWQNEPAKWDVGETTPGWLHITGELNRNLWGVDTVNKLYQEVSLDEFDIETHVVMDYQGASSVVTGLVAKSPADSDWTTMKFWGRGGDAILQWQHKQRGAGAGDPPGTNQPAGRVEYYIRMTKNGNEYMGYYKENEDDDWIETSLATIDLTPPLEVGIYAGIDAAAGTCIMEFEYFRDLLNPFETAVAPKGKLATYWGDIKSE
jgi:hypothetical protein